LISIKNKELNNTREKKQSKARCFCFSSSFLDRLFKKEQIQEIKKSNETQQNSNSPNK